MDWYIEMMKAAGEPLPQDQNPPSIEPVNKPGLDRLERDEVQSKRPSMWNIILHNDDYAPMDFIEFVLMSIFHIRWTPNVRQPEPSSKV